LGYIGTWRLVTSSSKETSTEIFRILKGLEGTMVQHTQEEDGAFLGRTFSWLHKEKKAMRLAGGHLENINLIYLLRYNHAHL